MRYIDDFPFEIEEVENFWIQLSDSTRLAGRRWHPKDVAVYPLPAILQYMPYRKRDFTAVRDEVMHRYFAGHGYVSVRVDIRGSGDSDGLMYDEYERAEILDGAEVVEWLAGQEWCNGSVGMLGNSWSGFNSLQVAAEAPPSLKAIITSCSTDDRYSDDMHYMGGCLLTDLMDWGTVFFGNFPRPPDSQVVGDRWREMWHERLENMPLPIESWLNHQKRDDYWKPGSVCEDYSRIKCAVYACAGWLDGYSNTVARLLSNLSSPRLGLIGPWKHAFPHAGFPGPTFHWLQEAVRWWDHWLKDIDTGIMDLPMYRVFLQEQVPTQAIFNSVPGRWVSESVWPSPNIFEDRLYLSEHGLSCAPQRELNTVTVRSPVTTGGAGGEWCPGGTGGTGAEFATDQREDDGKSVVFDSEPLSDQYQILGAPVVSLMVSSDKPQANVAVRLCDVSPDGQSARVSFGVLNLSHRDSHEHPQPLVPGRSERVDIKLNDCAHAFRVGNRIRLAISSHYWPMIWPSPEDPTLVISTAECYLNLPQRSENSSDDWQPEEGEAQGAVHGEITWLREGSYGRSKHIDDLEGTTDLINEVDEGHYRLEQTGLTVGGTKHEVSRIRENQPTSAECIFERSQQMGRDDNPISFNLRARLSCDRDNFFVEGTCDTYESEKRIHSKVWNLAILRDHL